MFKNKKREKLIYGIIGLGRFGTALASELAIAGADMIIVDKDEERIDFAKDLTENAYIVKNLEKKTLIETGMQNCDVVALCIGEQIDVSILTTLNLISMGIPKVIAKASSSEHGDILEKLGAEVVYPERDMALRLAHRLETSESLDFIQLSEKLNISKFILPSQAEGKTIIDVNFRGRFGLNIIAIENANEINESVRPDYIFKKGDILYLAGSKEGFVKFADWSNYKK
ncbi:MAG: TrkA family potassium uptake protein [Clostridia bacterium]|nr:TrkA family potassium uptake protein [Clostridia bacterium]